MTSCWSSHTRGPSQHRPTLYVAQRELSPPHPCPSVYALSSLAHTAGQADLLSQDFGGGLLFGCVWNGQGEQFPLPRGQPDCKPWITCCTSVPAALGEPPGGASTGHAPGAGVRSLLPPSTKTGKLRPRGAKDLLATSQSETSVMRARIGIEDLSWAKLCSTSWTGVLIFLAALVNLDYPAPGAWMCPIETTRFSLPSPSESKHGY